jgi:inner membrane protein
MDWLEPPWGWFILGLVLAGAEMIAPGVFLIWLASAAILTGVIAFLSPIGLELQIAVFALLSVLVVFSAKRWLAENPVASADPLMNDRGGRLIGETVVVAQALDGGSGRVRQGDTEWLAKGPDAAPGTRMRVTGHDGAILIVDHLSQPQAAPPATT